MGRHGVLDRPGPGRDAGIVPSRDPQLGLPAGGEVQGALGGGDGGGGLDGCAEDQGHAVGQAAVDPAVVVRFRHDPSFIHPEGVVGLGAPQLRQGETVSELHALDGGNGEEGVGQQSFHGVEPGSAESGGQTEDGGLQDPADAVALPGGGQDRSLHLLAPGLVQHGEGRPLQGVQIRCRVPEAPIRHPRAAGQVGADADSPLPESSQEDGSGGNQGGCQPSGEVAAAPGVGKALVFDAPGVVRVTGPGDIL